MYFVSTQVCIKKQIYNISGVATCISIKLFYMYYIAL